MWYYQVLYSSITKVAHIIKEDLFVNSLIYYHSTNVDRYARKYGGYTFSKKCAFSCVGMRNPTFVYF